MTAPAIPAPAALLETRYDRAVRLRASYEQLLHRRARTADPHTRAALDRHLDLVDRALTRLGATP
ncbi:hypothetical protein [Nocardiopsis synnemataformans]|uniref:hypothetical protein n=1 Tax=Nocardiopsis synnemataformans TaxID=61305 RepID=UPI003EBD8173